MLAATWPGSQGELALAGEGAPLVAEFCVAEFAAAIGRSTDSGRALIAHALELKYRLPKTHRRVESVGDPGGLEPWKARRIAEATLGLSLDAVRFVDDQVAAFAHKIGRAQLDRLIAEAIARSMPDLARENAERAADRRHVTFHHQQVSFDGTTFLEAELDLADALDLDAALGRGADELKRCGSDESLDVRRAIAAGDLARHQLALDLTSGAAPDEARTSAPKPRQVVLYVHLSEAAITGHHTGLDLARVENHRQGVTADQIRRWCANPDTQVVVKPVIDLAKHVGVASYEVPDRLAEHTTLRDLTCVFPWCTRPARRCDRDHAVAHADGGTTCSCNITPVCRRHHRLKTHSPWTYTVIDPGTYLWTSPHGYQFLRDHHGTLDVSHDRQPPRSTDPPHF